MSQSRACVLPVLAVLAITGAAAAQELRPMTIVDLLNVPRLSDVDLSPDGTQVLYVRSDPSWKTNKRVGHVWRVQADGSRPVQMTNGPEGESSPRWSPDGRTIAFLAKRADAESTQIHLMANDGGEARALTDHASSISSIAWSPDGASILFLAPEPKTAEEKAREKQKDDVFSFDEDFKQQHLWKVDVSDKAERRLTQGDYSITSYDLSRDGTRIAFHKAPNPLFGSADRNEVWVMRADGSAPVQITTNAVPEQGATLSPDGSQVLFLAGANAEFQIYYNRRIFVAPAAGGAARVVADGLPYEVESARWSKDGRSILFKANMGVHSQLFSVDLAGGKPKQLTDGRHAISSWSLQPTAGRIVMLVDEPERPGEVWLMSAAGGAPARVTRVFDDLARRYRLPRQERLEWKGKDGVTVEGLLYYPLDYRASQKYPLVVQTHGGPQASDKFGFGGWSSYVQVLAAKGYAVLKPNYRGSTGYGDPFLRDMVGSYFKNSHLDVIAGVDHLISLGIADPDRLVKMGWSGGGHMTNKVITFTNRFKAASSGAGAANWVSMYAQSDVRTYRTPWFGGTPWQKNAPIDLYWEHSPLKYVANVTTPTIFLVGEKDVRVPPPQSVEMHRALLASGVPTKLYVAPREPHGWQELRHQLFKVNVELDWFEKWVTKRPYVWEKPPEPLKEKEGEKETRPTPN
jgi:dipeptidyl aminopeptidase/acylaminoacyl peptidase